jgi:hypothetical protein
LVAAAEGKESEGLPEDDDPNADVGCEPVAVDASAGLPKAVAPNAVEPNAEAGAGLLVSAAAVNEDFPNAEGAPKADGPNGDAGFPPNPLPAGCEDGDGLPNADAPNAVGAWPNDEVPNGEGAAWEVVAGLVAVVEGSLVGVLKDDVPKAEAPKADAAGGVPVDGVPNGELPNPVAGFAVGEDVPKALVPKAGGADGLPKPPSVGSLTGPPKPKVGFDEGGAVKGLGDAVVDRSGIAAAGVENWEAVGGV